MDWVDPNSSDPVEEREDDMSSLPVGFATQMIKRAASAQGETTPLALKYLAESAQSGPAQMKRLRRAWQ